MIGAALVGLRVAGGQGLDDLCSGSGVCVCVCVCPTGLGKSSFHSNCDLELGIALETLQGQIDLI